MIPNKRQKIYNDAFNMIPVKDALESSLITTSIDKKFNILQKKINNIEIITHKNQETIESLTREISKLSEVLMFYIDKKEIKQELKIDRNPEYIS